MNLIKLKKKNINLFSIKTGINNRLKCVKTNNLVRAVRMQSHLFLNRVGVNRGVHYALSNVNKVKFKHNANEIMQKLKTQVAYNKILLNSKYNNAMFSINLFNEGVANKLHSFHNLKLYNRCVYDYKLSNTGICIHNQNDDFLNQIYKEDITELLKNPKWYDDMVASLNMCK